MSFFVALPQNLTAIICLTFVPAFLLGVLWFQTIRGRRITPDDEKAIKVASLYLSAIHGCMLLLFFVLVPTPWSRWFLGMLAWYSYLTYQHFKVYWHFRNKYLPTRTLLGRARV